MSASGRPWIAPKPNSKTRVRHTHSRPTYRHRARVSSLIQCANQTAMMRIMHESNTPLSTRPTGLLRFGISTASRNVPLMMANSRIRNQTATGLMFGNQRPLNGFADPIDVFNFHYSLRGAVACNGYHRAPNLFRSTDRIRQGSAQYAP